MSTYYLESMPMLLPIILLLQDATNVAAALAEYREKTSAIIRCSQPKDDSEVTVCARRESYRYQTPLVASTNRANDANAQENILLTREARGGVECGKGAFMVGCGSVGVGMSVTSRGVRYRQRETPQ